MPASPGQHQASERGFLPWQSATFILLLLGCRILLFASANAAPPAPSPVKFEDIAELAGLNFVLDNSPTSQKHLVETLPGGIALFDYNHDGLIDVFFTNGAELPQMEKTNKKYSNRLFRNEGNFRFKDVTEEAGLGGSGYSIGVAVADFDNDGNIDLFVAGAYHNLLYRNRGDGRFEDITSKAGIQSDQLSVAAGWFDFDQDGRLDLLVINYAKWTPSFDRYCGDRERDLRVYCHPKYFDPVPNQLYRNRGDGTFENVSQTSGIAKYLGRGMSVAFGDYDQDGRIDAFITNDNLPNFLFHNLPNGTFEEVALHAGVALLDSGSPVSSMGTDFRDLDNDGLPDLVFTALRGETFPVFLNQGSGQFRDFTYQSKIAQESFPFSGWGIGIFDFNNDGWKDIFTANSHVDNLVETFVSGEYAQQNTVFVNQQNGKFLRDGAAGLLVKRPHRASGFADLNNDGKIDVVVSCFGEPAELLKNVSPDHHAWLILFLEGTKSNRDGIGAVVKIGNQTNIMTTAVGYASSSYSGVHFGLGDQTVAKKIEIQWPSGIRQVLTNVPLNQVLHVRESLQ
ncbi:MAG: CRTAC1 family protein [Acidobacteria bacterium]|nr:CRTAC1 family protein [Acidobacteriota bacterium]